MSERFNIAYGGNVITDTDGRDLDLTVKWCVEELVGLLNGQQATINEFSRELAKLLDKYDEKKKEIKEQQATIEDMGDANATLETEILKLRQELKEYKENWDTMVEMASKTSLRNVELVEENAQLQQKIDYLCEKYDYGSDESMKVVYGTPKRCGKSYISYCPSNFIVFLEEKGLLRKSLLFSQRMALEKEFLKHCKKELQYD